MGEEGENKRFIVLLTALLALIALIFAVNYLAQTKAVLVVGIGVGMRPVGDRGQLLAFPFELSKERFDTLCSEHVSREPSL